MASHYLYLTNTRLASLIVRGGQVSARREFAVSDAGAAQFDAYLATVANVPIDLFTDLAEEDFRADTIAHVGARDREAIVSRKLGQIFRNTPYRHALVQGRETEGRRDDRVVYAAITNAEVVKPWLAVIEARAAPLAGMYSAAILGTRVVEALDAARPHTLLVHFSPGGALRQTYFRDGELRFTRLTPMDHEEGRSLGSFLAEETTRTWQYLDNLRSFGADDRLEVAVLAHPRDHAEIAPALAGFAQIAYRILDTDQVAATIGLKPPPSSSSAEEILVHLFGRRPIENHFATSEMRRYWTLRKARNAITAASAAVLATGIVVGGVNLAAILDAAEADQKTEREVAALNREYDQVTRSLPSFGVGGAAMRDAVTFYTTFIQGFPSLAGFLVPLSGVLASHPNVRLAQVAWHATDDPKAMPPMTVQPQRLPPPVKAMGKGTEVAVRSPTDEAAATLFDGGRYEVALIEATVNVPSHDFRGALADVERLAADIRRIRGFQAEVVESPLDVRTSLVLQGRHAEREAGAMEPRFILRVVHTRELPA